MVSRRAVGIDLGTTHSVVSCVGTAGHSELIRTVDGDRMTPSAVMFDAQRAIVGREALRHAPSEHLAACAKRDMGAESYSRPIGGLRLPPEVIQACVLRQLKGDIERSVGKDYGVVITVPAFFGAPRRDATADAAEIAGLPLLDILNEPTAAALAFGEHTGYLAGDNGNPPGGPLTALVYDLGGHTFEATLLRIEPGEITTLATDGDVHLGGHNFDLCIADHVAAQFKQRFREDPHDSPNCMEVLLREAERAVQTLSVRRSATIMLSHAGSVLEVRLTREEFETLAAGLVQKTTEITERLLGTAGVDWPALSRVMLVGGATRMPMVRRRLTELSGRMADCTVSPDEAVARGAALYAGRLLAKDGAASRQFKVTNVNAHSLGISGTNTKSGGKKNVILIPRNTPLPAKATKNFVLKGAAQRSISVTVLEGESSDPSECTPLGRAVIEDLPPDLKEGWPIEVTYEYQANGRLNVDARVPYTGRSVHLELERASGLSRERVARWKQAVESGGGLSALRNADSSTGGEHKARPVPVVTSTGAARPAADTQQAKPQDDAPAEQERAAPTQPAQPQPVPVAKTVPGYRAVPVARPREAGLVITWRKAVVALVGMLVGYYILCWIAPEINVLHLPVPGG